MMIKPNFLINSVLISILISTNLKFMNPLPVDSEDCEANLLTRIKKHEEIRTSLKEEQFVHSQYVVCGNHEYDSSKLTEINKQIIIDKKSFILQACINSTSETAVVAPGLFEEGLLDEVQLKKCINLLIESLEHLNYLCGECFSSLLKNCNLKALSQKNSFQQSLFSLKDNLCIILGKVSKISSKQLDKKEKLYINAIFLCKKIIQLNNEVLIDLVEELKDLNPEKVSFESRRQLIDTVFHINKTWMNLFKAFDDSFGEGAICLIELMKNLKSLIETGYKQRVSSDIMFFNELCKTPHDLYESSMQIFMFKLKAEKSKINEEKLAKELEIKEISGRLSKMVDTRKELNLKLKEKSSRLDAQKIRKEKFHNTTEGQILIGLGSVAVFGAAGAYFRYGQAARFAIGGGIFGGCLAACLIANANEKLEEADKQIGLLETRIKELTSEIQTSTPNEALWKSSSSEKEAYLAKKTKCLAEIEMTEQNINTMFLEVGEFIKQIDEELRKDEQK